MPLSRYYSGNYLSTDITIAKLPNITKLLLTAHLTPSLTVANQTEVPILLHVTLTLNTTIDDTSRQFNIPFAVADIKCNICGTPVFEEFIQNINIKEITLQLKHHSKEPPNSTKLTTLLSKDYPYFSYTYRINSAMQICLKPN